MHGECEAAKKCSLFERKSWSKSRCQRTAYTQTNKTSQVNEKSIKCASHKWYTRNENIKFQSFSYVLCATHRLWHAFNAEWAHSFQPNTNNSSRAILFSIFFSLFCRSLVIKTNCVYFCVYALCNFLWTEKVERDFSSSSSSSYGDQRAKGSSSASLEHSNKAFNA